MHGVAGESKAEAVQPRSSAMDKVESLGTFIKRSAGGNLSVEVEQALALAHVGRALTQEGFYEHSLRAFSKAAIMYEKLLLGAAAGKLSEYFRLWADAVFLQVVNLLYVGQGSEARQLYNNKIAFMHKKMELEIVRITAFPTIVVGSKFLKNDHGETAAQCFERAIRLLRKGAPIGQTKVLGGLSEGDKHVLGLAHVMLGNVCGKKRFKARFDLKEAERLYRTAIEFDNSLDDAYSGLATSLKDQGKLGEALEHYHAALTKSNLTRGKKAPPNLGEGSESDQGNLQYEGEDSVDFSATHTFNLAQCLEYVGSYAEAIALLDAYVVDTGMLDTRIDLSIEDWAILLLLSKLLYVGGKGLIVFMRRVPPLLERLLDIPEDARFRIKSGLKTHWAYTYYLRQLLTCSKVLAKPLIRNDEYENARKIPVVGDSHILSIAWHRVKGTSTDERTFTYLLDPHLVTGLMAWHVAREKTDCLPWANLENVLGRIRRGSNRGPGGKRKAKIPCVIFAGEIDCRSKLLESVKIREKYSTLEIAVKETVRRYLESLHKLAQRFHLVFFVASVTPPSNREEIQRARTVNLFNLSMKRAFESFESDYIRFLDLYKIMVSRGGQEEQFLNQEYVCDGTHANSNIVPIVQKKIEETIGRYKEDLLFT